ncbi:TPA: hypothetical protein L7V81_001628 [Klebsiella pneumoniae]|nr:hypothetical protein [Klebsiella pneumoniae]
MTTDIELAQSLKRRATSANEFGESLYVKADDVLSLVEALEKAQTKAIEQGRTACELFDEVTALRQRIAELEFIRTSADKVQREFADELGCAGDNESILQAIEDLKVQSSTALELKQAALVNNAHLKLELGILESSHKKLREGMAAIYNAICADGASTSVSAILTFVKRAHAESAAAGIKVEAE